MSERKTCTQDLRARLRAAALKLERELAEAAFRLHSGIAEQREKSVEKALANFGPRRAAAESYRRWRSLPSTQRATKLAIRALLMKERLTISERETLLRLRRTQMEDER